MKREPIMPHVIELTVPKKESLSIFLNMIRHHHIVILFWFVVFKITDGWNSTNN